MYKRIMLVLLISSPLLAVEEFSGISQRAKKGFVAPPRDQTMGTTSREPSKKESGCGEDLTCCPSFLPRVALMLLAGAVSVGGSAVSGIAKKAAFFKTD